MGDGGWCMGEGERGVGLLSETSSQLLEEKLLDKDIVLISKHPKTQRGCFSLLYNNRRTKICLSWYVCKKNVWRIDQCSVFWKKTTTTEKHSFISTTNIHWRQIYLKPKCLHAGTNLAKMAELIKIKITLFVAIISFEVDILVASISYQKKVKSLYHAIFDLREAILLKHQFRIVEGKSDPKYNCCRYHNYA